jgi:L-amino acid N-acyltransferase YncA
MCGRLRGRLESFTGMEASSLVRPASSKDARAGVAIYRPYVEDTAITFETEVPTTEQMAARIAAGRDGR